MDSARAKLVAFLQKTGTGNTKHSGRSLMDHLVGTYDILKKWGCAETICLAGGLHSIYGTNIFKTESLTESDRLVVRLAFGIEAEHLAWIFGTINRPRAIEYGFGIDRRNGQRITLNEKDIKPLRLIEAANLIEQGGTLNGWPKISSEADAAMRNQHS